MDQRIAVASLTFGAKFQGLVHAQLRKALQPGQSLVECAIPEIGDVAVARTRLLALLEREPRPVAVIALCLGVDPETVADFRAVGIPFILVDNAADGASTVASDNFGGGFVAGEHLVRIGRRSPALVYGGPRARHDYNAEQRLKGFERALARGGLTLLEEHVVEAREYSRKDGLEAMTQLLHASRKIDSVFCAAGDACATGLLATAHTRYVKIPEQIAVLGYDDSPLASLADPPLSTVRQPIDKIAREALRLATDSAATLEKPARVLIEPQLVLRASA
jgi:LacI family transcriptional regulator